MIKTAGNRIFAGLSSILNLPGTENLGKIDIGVAQPTYPLRELVERELIIPAIIVYDFTMPAGGATLEFPIDPYQADLEDADNRTVIVSQAKGSQPVLVAGTTTIDRDYDAYLVDFGVQYAASSIGAVTNTLYALFQTAVAPPDPSALVRVLHRWSGNQGIEGVTSSLPQTQTFSRVPYPIRFPNEAWGNLQEDRVKFQTFASPAGAEAGSCAGRLILCRKGVIPVFP